MRCRYTTLHSRLSARMQQLLVFLVIALCAAAHARPQSDVGVKEVFPGIGEYYYNGIPANWTTAFRQCQASGGHLTVINSVAEKEALQGMLTSHGASSVLVGFHDQFVEGVYTFITGWSLSVSDSLWAPGRPTGGSSTNCGSLNINGISDISCSTLSPFICELSEDQGSEDSSEGFAPLENFGYYKQHIEEVTWTEAWETCRRENADLMVIDSEDEILAVWDAYPNYGYIWVGIHRQWGPSDNFITVRNKPLSSLGYQQWAGDGEPWGSSATMPYVLQYALNGMGTQTGTFASMGFFCERPM